MSSSPPPNPFTAPAPSSPPTPPAASPPLPTTPSAPPPSTPPPSASPPPVPASAPPQSPPASSPPPASPAPPASTPPPDSASPPAPPALPPSSSPSPPAPASTPPPTSPPPEAPSVPSPPGGGTPSTPASPSAPATNSTPPSPSGRSPSPPSGRTPSTPSPPRAPSSQSSSNSISTPVVVGIAVGAVVFLAFFGILFCFCRKKKRGNPSPSEYHGGPPIPHPPKDDIYGGQQQYWQHNVPPPAHHVVKIPPYPSPPPAYGSRPPNSLPPPHVISSSGGSGSNYSGSETILPPPSPGIALGFSKSNFTYEELLMATNGFSDANLLGQGGFGYVHRGMLPNGKEVAVKQLKSGSGQGEREFQAEVEIISRVHHKHLVTLVGYCIAGGKRLLVYEFVPNNTLEFHLHEKGRPTMDWSTRLKIALGSAKGLAYLHEDCHPKIIHRDIKAANILLDFNFEAKVADFGLAKFASDTDTHVSTRVMGTFGYMAPEYASSGKLTDKSDVFSFGVMLLELITGQRPIDSTNTLMEGSLVDWARPLLTLALEDGNYDALVDPRLQNNFNTKEMVRMVACAAACVRHSARLRPRMSQIVRALEGDVSLEDLNEGVKPGHKSLYGSYGSSDYDSSLYNENMKKFRKLALTSEDYGSSDYGPVQNRGMKDSRRSVRTSQEYPSSEYSAATSDYGQNPSGSSSEGQRPHEMEMGSMKKGSSGFSGTS